MPREFWFLPRVGHGNCRQCIFGYIFPNRLERETSCLVCRTVSGWDITVYYKIFQDIFVIIIYYFAIDKRIMKDMKSVVGEQSR